MRPQYPKRLIEVDLPIKRISAHARREKSIRHGHISTLHIWWARRPLASCRAIICASLWFDPVDPLCPNGFMKSAKATMLAWATNHAGLASQDSFSQLVAIQKDPSLLDDSRYLRRVLFDFIADFSNWDNLTSREFRETSIALTEAAHGAICEDSGNRPLVLDPFAGGGSIPLESLRVGADVFASDLNPIPVLLNKVLLEYIPKYGKRLADEVRRCGEALKNEAMSELAEFYPTDGDGATAIAYIWARTIRCEGPGCGTELPLFTSPWLSKRKGRYKWLAFNGDSKRPEYKIIEDDKEPLPSPNGTISKGAATCPACGYTTAIRNVKRQLVEKAGGTQQAKLLAVVLSKPGFKGRIYREATVLDVTVANRASARLESGVGDVRPPEQEINTTSPGKFGSGVASPTRIGCKTFSDLFTKRQLLALCCMGSKVTKIEDPAVRTLLAFAVDRLADYNSAQSRWAASGEFIGNTFGRQAIPIVWSFAEINPFSGASGDWDGAVNWIAKVVESTAASNLDPGVAVRSSANLVNLPDDSVHAVITDPPYYGSILYSDLADFFYVWLRQTLGDLYPELFGAELIEKEHETVATPTAVGPNGEVKDSAFFESSMTEALSNARRILRPDGIATIVFAHKSTSGWEAMLAALVSSGWIVTGSWPIDTERQARTNAQGAATLSSSVHLVCRPRKNEDGSLRVDAIGDWRDVLQELPRRIHEWMPRLALEGIVGEDAIFACLGPALEVFSRYSRVEKTDGTIVKLREYLEHVWAAVSKEALNMVFDTADAGGFEQDARLTAVWLWTLSTGKLANSDDEGQNKVIHSTGYILEFDTARKIAQGLGVHMEDLPSLVEIKGEKSRLLPAAERASFLFGKVEDGAGVGRSRKMKPKQDDFFDELNEAEVAGDWGGVGAPKPGHTNLDRVHQGMILFAAGRAEALKRFLVEQGAGGDPQFWSLAQALSALYPPATDDKRWVDGLLARKKALGF